MRKRKITRRGVLKGGAAAAAMVLEALHQTPAFAGRALTPVTKVDNPLEYYPDRDWEKFTAINTPMTALSLSFVRPMTPTPVVSGRLCATAS